MIKISHDGNRLVKLHMLTENFGATELKILIQVLVCGRKARDGCTITCHGMEQFDCKTGNLIKFPRQKLEI